MNGKFITVEGGEGVGKSLFVKLLASALKERGIDSLLTREPGGTPIADTLREIFIHPPQKESLTVEAEFCIVSAARAQHINNKIRPAIEEGRWVICDRFADSSRVYQGMLGGVSTPTLEKIIEFTTFGITPDVTFLLDCETSIALSRLATRMNSNDTSTETNRFDEAQESFHRRLRQCFIDLCDLFPDRMVILDTSKEPNEIVTAALAMLESRLILEPR